MLPYHQHNTEQDSSTHGLADLELDILLSKLLLDVQQVLGCELTQAEDAQEVEVCQVVRVLALQITIGHNAHHPLKGIQVRIPDL